MSKPKPEDIRNGLNEATNEGLLFLAKAFRGAVDLEEQRNRSLLSAATSTVSSWSRYEATQSSREAVRFAMAGVIAREEGRKVSDLMRITMPEHSVVRRLPQLQSGD